MPQNQKKRQKALERQKAKRKQKKQVANIGAPPASEAAQIRAAANWPLEEVLVSRDWQNVEEITQILVARQGPSGKIAIAMFLVDLGCLGVKNALTRTFPSWLDYKERLRDSLIDSQPMQKTDLNLAAKIIREAVAYAKKLGFNPSSDYGLASALLAGADPDAVSTEVPLGRDGKPFFIAGPYDKAEFVIKKLEKAVGPGNFDYVAFVDELPAGFEGFDDEDYDDEDEPDDEEAEEAIKQIQAQKDTSPISGLKNLFSFKKQD